MAYEYEGYIKNTIRTEAVFSHEIEQKYDRILELEEVYRKTKAFDAIVNIEDDFVKYHGFYPCVEEYAEEVEDIISEYLEDE